MKISELIAQLKAVQNVAGDVDVILSEDSEGNAYSPAGVTERGMYRPINSWSGEIGIRELTPELIEEGYGPDDILDGASEAVVIWPIN